MAYRNGMLMKVAWAGAVSVFGGVLLLWPGGSDAQEGGRGPRGKLSTPQAELLTWLMPPGVDKSYDAIDAEKLHGYVREQAAISLRSRDAGNQYWGRIAGMPSGTETQNWVKDKFKAMGVPYETVSIPAAADYLGVECIVALVLKANRPSIAVLQSAGFLLAGEEDFHFETSNEQRSCLRYVRRFRRNGVPPERPAH